MEEVRELLQTAVKAAFNEDVRLELTRPEEQFGDFATNIALQLAKKLGQNPREVAQKIVAELPNDSIIAKAEIAGPGFINVTLTDKALGKIADEPVPQILKDQVTIVEYSDPNPFKVLHVGHLYDSVLGEAVANLCEVVGAKVHRVNFGGDVGLHVGKTLWAVLQQLGGENPEKLNHIEEGKRSDWLTAAYIEGTRAYEDDEKAKQEITALNKKVYEIHAQDDHDSPLAQIYWTTRGWSYDYFNAFYDRIGTKFEKYYPESATAPVGLKAVQEQLKNGVFEESDGAVVFKGEVHNLHTRVFINSNGLPTYETKDIGLALSKWNDYKFDRTIILTGNEIVEYMKVVLAALRAFAPEIAERTRHLPHGMVKLAGGTKMSSRKGNILRAVDVLDMTADAMKAVRESSTEQTVQAAVKYAFVKQRMSGDIIFDPAESVSMEGNSGPYLQYAHARACSILAKAGETKETELDNLEPAERSLLRKIGEYAEVVERAATELAPHHIATYLYELAQAFNRFYEKNRVIDDARQDTRVQLVKMYSERLKHGLELLGISAPERM